MCHRQRSHCDQQVTVRPMVHDGAFAPKRGAPSMSGAFFWRAPTRLFKGQFQSHHAVLGDRLVVRDQEDAFRLDLRTGEQGLL